jgi:GT2 family glycosyltransferase
MKISIIIPNFNGEENLKNNLPRVIKAAAHGSHETEIIVVDDTSTDKSREILKSFPRVITLENEQNQGFAATCNAGVKKSTGEIIILLNSDVYPAEDFINPLVSHFEHDDRVFAVGCLEKVLDINNQVVEERGVGVLFFKGGIFQHRAGDLNSGKTDWVCGGSGAFRKDIFLALHGFSTEYKPFYWEDIDLSFRAKKAGYKLLFERNAVVYHKHVFGSIAQKYTLSEVERISFKNQIKFTKKHASSLRQKISYFFFLAKQFLRR